MCGHLTVVEYLIAMKKCGVDDVDAKRGATALHFSCWGGHNALVMYLCSKGADCNKTALRYKQSSPLHWAAKQGKIGCAEILLHHGCDIDQKDEVNAISITDRHLMPFNLFNISIRRVQQRYIGHVEKGNRKWFAGCSSRVQTAPLSTTQAKQLVHF
jgi:ankyrin repeat protein